MFRLEQKRSKKAEPVPAAVHDRQDAEAAWTDGEPKAAQPGGTTQWPLAHANKSNAVWSADFKLPGGRAAPPRNNPVDRDHEPSGRKY
jgi:hypothetical protein